MNNIMNIIDERINNLVREYDSKVVKLYDNAVMVNGLDDILNGNVEMMKRIGGMRRRVAMIKMGERVGERGGVMVNKVV